MKKIFLIIIAALLSASSLHAQSGGNSATAGKEFYITFARLVGVLQLKVVVDKECYITAEYNNQPGTYWNNWDGVLLIPPGIYTNNVLNVNVVNMGATEPTSSKTITLISTEDVCVYAIDYVQYTTDATCVLPVAAWGTEYRLATGVQSNATGNANYYAVVANENNTLVTLHDNTTKLLNKNQVYHFYTPAWPIITDLTGQKVTATKPVALFSGTLAASGPSGFYGCSGIGGSSADITYEQLWSIEKWGKEFFAFPILTPGGNGNWGGMLALVADENGTRITLSGGINGGDDITYDLNAGEKKYVCHVMSGLTRIVSDKPIMVFLILPDATVTNIIPVAQRIKRATVAPFILTGNTMINQHGIDMLVPVAWWNKTVIKENGVDLTDTYTVNDSDYFPDWYHIRKNLPDEDVVIEITCAGGFLAYMSGNGAAESYAFLAGTGAYDLQNYFTIQEKATTIDTYYENTTELTHTFETSDMIVVKRTVERDFDAIEWWINGTLYPIAENSNNTNELDFPASALKSGENSLTMSVRYSEATQDSLYTGKVWLENPNGKIFKIWNWADLAYLRVLCETGELCNYEGFLLMQNLGVPNKPSTYGDGSATTQNGNIACPYTDGERKYGYYGYQNYTTAAAYNPAATANNPLTVGIIGTIDPIDEAWKLDHTGWLPIGNDVTPFTGNFNGAGHKITGLWINRTGDYIGLFGFIDGAVIKNVGVILKGN